MEEPLKRRTPMTRYLPSRFHVSLAVALGLAFLLLVGLAPAQAPVQVGEILILSTSGGTSIPASLSPTPTFTGTPTPAGALFVLNLDTKTSRLLSDFGNAKQGDYLPNPTSVTVLGSTQDQRPIIVVVDGRRGVYQVDPTTGNRTPAQKLSGPGGTATPTSLAVVQAPPR
jgi:hypothetical protein